MKNLTRKELAQARLRRHRPFTQEGPVCRVPLAGSGFDTLAKSLLVVPNWRCSVAKPLNLWRATADEDGHYCFAVAL
jgi:hypothetical protein